MSDDGLRKWVVPALMLTILLWAHQTRWQVKASKSTDYEVMKWVQDRWLGEVWLQSYGYQGVVDMPVTAIGSDTSVPRINKDVIASATMARKIASWAWDALFAADALWLLLAAKASRRTLPNKEAPPV